MARVHLTPRAAEKLTSVVKAVERWTDPLLQASQHDAPPQRPQLGIIQSRGPAAEPDFEDARYWVRTAFVSNDSGTVSEPATVIEYPEGTERFAIRQVTNLAEAQIGTHALSAGQIVTMWWRPDRSTVPVRRWLMLAEIGTMFCIVRAVQETGDSVTVEAVHYDATDGKWKTRGDPFEVAAYPVMQSKHYEALIVPTPPPPPPPDDPDDPIPPVPEQVANQGWPILELKRAGGVLVVHPWTKRLTLPVTHADGHRLDDCEPLTGVIR